MPRSVRPTFSRRGDGDFGIDGDPELLARRRQALAPGAWTWLRQVHGGDLVVVAEPGDHAGAEADAAVTDVAGAVLAIHTADCAPVLLAADDGSVVGAAHAGWRGLLAGVLEATVGAMGRLGATGITAHVGPHIRARCYEFGATDLDAVADRYGPRVRGETAAGAPALDVTAAVRLALEPLGVIVEDHGGCTACEPARYFSHRARADTGRMAATVAIHDDPPPASEVVDRPAVVDPRPAKGFGRGEAAS